MPACRFSHLDHLVYASPDLELACADLENRLGVRPSKGGRHDGRGTRNALMAIGPETYLEIVASDPEQQRPALPRWFDVDRLTEARLVAWAVRTDNLSGVAAEAERRGVHLGPIATGSRQGPHGDVITWRFTDPETVVANGLVPFFIDWGGSTHPATTAAAGPPLVDLRAFHPDPKLVQNLLSAFGLSLRVDIAPSPALEATFRTSTGLVHLR
jgi:glyoxalase-like protein